MQSSGLAAVPASRAFFSLRWLYRTAVAIFLFGWFAATVYVLVLAVPATHNSPAPPLTIDPASVDFGTVWNCEHFRWTFPIKNTGDATIQVGKVEGSCGCTSVNPTAFVLSPGQQVNVTVNINFVSRSGAQPWPPSEPIDQLISAYKVGDEVRPIISWHLRGVVKNALFTTPDHLDFADSLLEGQRYPPKPLEVTCYGPCRDLIVSVDDQFGVASVRNPSGDGRHFQVFVAPKPTLAIGVHRFKLGLAALLQSGERTPPVPIWVEAQVLQDLQVLPSLAHFGDLRIGDAREETISLHSRTGQPFEIAEYTSSSNDVTVTAESQDPSGDKVFRVRVRPKKSGPQDGVVRFAVQYTQKTGSRLKGRSSTALLNVRYHGFEKEVH